MSETLPGIDEMLGIPTQQTNPTELMAQSNAMSVSDTTSMLPREVLSEPIPGIDEQVLELSIDQWQNSADTDENQAHRKALRLQAAVAARALHETAIHRLTEQRTAGLKPEPQILPAASRSVRVLTQDVVVSLDNALRLNRIKVGSSAGNYALSIA